jgi:endoglucanase
MAITFRLSAPRCIAAAIILACAGLGLMVPRAGLTAGPPPPAVHTPLTCPQFGVNLSAGEFGSALPGVYGFDYIYPGIDDGTHSNAWELDYFHSKGLNLIRLGVRWERLQHDLYGPLTDYDIGLIDQVLANAAARGMTVVIVPHNEARRNINGTDYLIGSPQVPYAASTDFWRRMAEHFAGNPGLYGYSLDNEPHDTGGLWITGGAQAGIDGVRQADMVAPILVPGDGWSGAWSWIANGNDGLRALNDPAHNLIFDAHQYFDSDASGHYTLSYDDQGAYPMLGVDLLTSFVEWLHTNNLRGIVSEYGVPDDDPRWLTVLDNALAYLQDNSDVIAGGMDWSAGPWWGVYKLSVEPTGTWPNVTDRPQMSVLAARTGCSSTCTVTFEDVPQGSTFYDFIECLACRGIVGGYPCGGPGEPCPGGYFRPNNNVTRGQVSKIVSESAGFSEPVPSTQQTFEDVPPGSTFALWVERLSTRGIIGGYPCGAPGEPCVAPDNRPYFRPNNNVTRGQLSKITSGAAGWTETPTGQTFEDVPPGQTFYLTVERMSGHGIIGGYPCGGPGEPCVAPANRAYFRPNNPATRGQLSKIAANTFFPGCQAPTKR